MSYVGQFATEIIPGGLVILADSGYRLLNYVMVPYSENGGKTTLTAEQRYYNYVLSRSRIVVEKTFGWLKNRFRSLKGPLNRHHKGNALDIASAIIFHTLLIDFNIILTPFCRKIFC